MSENEEWRAIESTDGRYEVSNLGRVRRSVHGMKTWPGRILKLTTGAFGYTVVDLQTGRQGRVHRLVAEAFIPNPEGKPQVNHKDGVKSNNCVDNLEWVTGSENVHHAFRLGLRMATTGERHGMATLSEAQVAEIRMAQGPRGIGRELARRYGVSEATVSVIRSGKRWRHSAAAQSETQCL